MTMDPLVSYTFCLEIDGIQAAFFSEGAGFDSEVAVIEHRENGAGGKEIVRKLPGQKKWSDITLKRGSTNALDLWEWHKKILDGDVMGARKNGSIVIYDTMLKEVARFNFVNGWPSRLSITNLAAPGNEVLIEECVITHEGLALA